MVPTPPLEIPVADEGLRLKETMLVMRAFEPDEWRSF
jgi:hypothetical protein